MATVPQATLAPPLASSPLPAAGTVQPAPVAAPPAHSAGSGSAIGGILASAALAGGIGVLAYRLFLAEQRLDALETAAKTRPALPVSTFRPVAAPVPQVEPPPAPAPAPEPPPEEPQGVDAAAKVPARAPDSDDEEGPP